jgi:tRNA(Ile)-lysidine synthase
LTEGLAAEFDAAMASAGPYGPSPLLAVAVSGGADSLAMALLADEWARRHGGLVIALIIDHGLRAASAAEARATAVLLAERGISSRVITLDLPPGSAMQARARVARHQALAIAAREAGAVHLLFGHHRRDQAETATMRAERGSRGLGGMAGLTVSRDVIMLRPLLGIAPECLRQFLRARNCVWIEDPSNADQRFERVRVRALVNEGLGAAHDVIHDAGITRHAAMRAVARLLARDCEIHAEGFALWRGTTMPPDVLAELLRVIGGRIYAPDRAAVARLAEDLRRATLGGVQVARWRDAWLLAREPAACGPPVIARPGAIWDGRFKLMSVFDAAGTEMRSFHLGALGRDAAAFRKISDLPSLILRGLPAVYDCASIIAVPHLDYGPPYTVALAPPAPAAPFAFPLHPFV